MKEYKYKINGNSYKVTIGDIEDNIAHVEVNGTHYKVEMEKQAEGGTCKTGSTPIAELSGCSYHTGSETGCTVYRKIRCQISATGCYTRHKSERRRHSEERTNHYYIGSHENGKQYQCRQRR